ncbi:MAG: hypothetical protein KKB31_07290 [Nanoarchaeota archaeon]|nr:hypothetical protein [Nanoarchaeota archaeon]
MALTLEDREAIELAIITTLNTRLERFGNRLAECEKSAEGAHTRISVLIAYLAGAGVLSGVGYGIFRILGG